MSNEFKDKVVLVTGAGAGLGKAHALQFAERGAKVVVNDLGGSVTGGGSGDAADEVVAEIRAAGGIAIANKGSVADRADAAGMVQDAVDEFGTIDIVVNNAGIVRDRSFKKMTLDDFDLVMQVHLTGTAYVTHAAWPIMYEKNYGRIVFTSSGSGVFGNFGQANYAAAKMGMVGMMNVLALEGASHNIKVNCLCPGAATRMTATIPGRDENVETPDPIRAPGLVTPAVLLMCADDAPTGKIIQGSGGRFTQAAVFVNKGVELGLEASMETITANKDTLLDMSAAKPGALRKPVTK